MSKRKWTAMDTSHLRHMDCTTDYETMLCERAADRIEEHEASDRLRYEADMRAIKRWQEANPGNDLKWPDHADLCVWLMERIEELETAHVEADKLFHQIADQRDELQRKYEALIDGTRNTKRYDIRKANVSWIAHHATEAAYEMDGLYERIAELEELEDRVANGFQGGCWCCEIVGEKNIELQRRYDALVGGINSAQSHTAEALRLLQWDQLGWDVPEEVIESLGKVDSQLRALL